MNHCYRLVWSPLSNRLVPAPETARGRGRTGRRRAQAVATACAALISTTAWAGPTGGTVSAGSGSIAQSGKTTTVTQTSQNLAINWAGFSVGSGETVNFVQPDRQAIVLNRVTGREASVIDGALNANGQVWLLNANGVLFGRNASVNVGGLVASTLSLGDADFMAGRSRFTADGSQGTVSNQGSLSGGYVALLGQQVSNSGRIQTPGGSTALAAGDAMTLSFAGGSLLSVQVDAGTYRALVENRGLIQADDGHVLMSATAKDALLSTVVNNTGVIQARGLSTDGGTIKLLAGGDSGTVQVGGTLDASSAAHNGGFIETSGPQVQVGAEARLSTLSGSGRTGTWLLDPTDFTIAAGSSAQTSSGIGATTLNTQLASTNVTLATAASGSDAGNLYVNAPVSWSANTTLTLTAANNLYLNSPITATGSSAGLALNYGGDYRVAAPVTLSGSSATLSLNGQAYTLIHSMAQLDALDGGSGRYALAQDLDASGTTYTTSVVGGTFTGTLAGLGHTVSGLTINAPSLAYVGLFSRSAGTIRDLGLLGGSVAGGSYVGSLVGWLASGGQVSGAYSTADVSADASTGRSAGGLVGFSEGRISNAYATGNVSGYRGVGGLLGQSNRSASLSDSYATGNVTGNTILGSLAGEINAGFSNVFATGRVTASSSASVGGLVGYQTGTATNAYWDPASTGQSNAAGTGSATGITAVTGAAAYQHGSYAGLGSWAETSAGSGVWVASSAGNKQWVMIEGATRPLLYSEYSTSISNAHQLQLMAVDPTASYTLARNIDASATSGSNASSLWSASGFAPIGNDDQRFSGTLDGQLHQISGLTISRPTQQWVGLIGYNDTAGRLQNIVLSGGNVTGGTDGVGALVGKNEGLVTGAGASATVVSTATAGGLIGINAGTVSNSFASGEVRSDSLAGGLAGTNDGQLTDVYATGRVATPLHGGSAGGLVGISTGTITRAYSASITEGEHTGGLVSGRIGLGDIQQSFWLSANNSEANTGGEGLYDTRGLSSSEATAASTYRAVGWDVSTTSGSRAVWRLYEGQAMPVLRSFLTPLTVSASGTKTYDGSSTSSGLSLSYSSAADTQLLSGTALVHTTGKNVGTYTTTVSGLYSTQLGYDLNFATGSLTINPATLSVTGTTVAAKVYDGTTTASLAGGSLAGTIYGSDVVTLTQSGSFVDKNVGTGKTVNISRTLSGADAGNYVLASGASSQATADISAALLTVTGTAVAANKVYDGSTAASISGLSIASGIAPGDQVTLNTSGQFADKNVGTGKTVTFSWALAGADAGNYVALASGSTPLLANITPKALTARVVAADKIYDGSTTASLSSSLSGAVAGDDLTLEANGSFADKNAGLSKTVNLSFSLNGTDARNYSLRGVTSTTANISAALLTVTGGAAANKEYDGTTAARVSGGMLAGTVYGNDVVALTQSGSFVDKHAGTGKAVIISNTLSGADAGNYVLASGSTGSQATASITPKALTASIVAADKVYDGSSTASTSGTLTGVLGSDTVSLTSSGTFADKNAGTGKVVNLSAALAGADAANYTLTSNTSATASITPKALTASIVAADKVYDGSTSASTSGTLAGVVTGDTVSLTSSGTFADKNAGTAKVVNLSAQLTGADQGNYRLISNGQTQASITPRALTVTADSLSKSVDGRAFTGGGVHYDGFVAGDDATALGGTLHYGGNAIGAVLGGSYTISVSGLTARNYALRYVDGVLTLNGSSQQDVRAQMAQTIASQVTPAITQAAVTGSAASPDAVIRLPDGGVSLPGQGKSLLNVFSCGLSTLQANGATCSNSQ